MRRVTVYVDGFNLFYGLRSAFRRRYHWLDVEALATEFLLPDMSLTKVRYFTARVRSDPPAEHRQDVYLQALAAHCRRLEIVEGRFQRKLVQCRRCRTVRVSYEEKESDVSLAVALVEDAARDAFDVAMLISADSDLCPAVRASHRLQPMTQVIAMFPPRRQSPQLARAVNDMVFVNQSMLIRSQLPAEVVTPKGIKLSRPAHWA